MREVRSVDGLYARERVLLPEWARVRVAEGEAGAADQGRSLSGEYVQEGAEQ